MNWSRYPNFSASEFMCRCSCGAALMDESFMDKLQTLRDAFKAPIIINSGYRCPQYNAEVSNTGLNGPHTTGRAADIGIRGAAAHALLKLALNLGFSGIGVSQKGAGRFIHLDILEGLARPGVWSY